VERDLRNQEIIMPSAEQLRSRLLKKLSELFQLDQPDLDFGFYRIMHAKAREVQDFIGADLLKIVADAFGDADEAQKASIWSETPFFLISKFRDI
jgi:adenine-specific DNA-methyltransferase